MNRAESKYFNTAAKMDEALLRLLEQKEFAFLTVKELCAAAGVNRSTFYLHYETLADLLNETVEHLNRQFLDYMQQDSAAFVAKLRTCPREELYLATPEYLVPYLKYIKEHARLFRTALHNAAPLQMRHSYARMFEHIFHPILERFGVPPADQPYLMTFYIHGLMAMVSAWLDRDCAESVEHLAELMERCVLGGKTE